MGFGTIFNESLKDYKNNFLSIVKILLMLVIVPALIYLIISAVWAGSGSVKELLSQRDALKMQVQQMSIISYQAVLSGQGIDEGGSAALVSLNQQLKDINGKLLPYNLGMFGLSVVLALVMFLAVSSFISASTLNKKFSYKEAIRTGKSLYWRYLGLFLLLGLVYGVIFVVVSLMYFAIAGSALKETVGDILLSGNFATLVGYLLAYLAVLIIAIVPLFIYFQFSQYALAEERKVFAAMGKSWKSVCGKWWKVFGQTFLYSILVGFFYVILLLIEYFVLGAPSNIIEFAQALEDAKISILLLNLIWEVFYLFVVAPVSILFFKNLYFSIRLRKK